MSKHPSHSTGFGPLIIAIIGVAAFASMVWTIAGDASLASVMWPSDIHRRFVSLLGGQTILSPSGVEQFQVPWSAVFIRVLIMLLGLVTFSSWICGPATRGIAANLNSRPAGWLRRFADHFRLTAMPLFASVGWLLGWYLTPLIPGDSFAAFFITTTPLFVAMIAAGSVSRFVGLVSARGELSEGVSCTATPSRRMSPEFLVVVATMLAWEATSFWMNERLYAGLLVPHGDSAMYEEHLWNIWHGKGFRSYLDQGLFLGEHIQLIHLLLLPLHRIWPSYLMMEFCASLSLAICAVPIFSLAKRHSGSKRAAMWLALAWLFFFPMHFLDIAIDLKTLRPSCYGLPFLFWGIDFAERRRLWSASVCLLISLSTQEDFSLIVGSIGLVFCLTTFRHRLDSVTDVKDPFSPDLSPADSDARNSASIRQMRIWSAGVLLFSVAYLLLAVLVIIPAFRGGDVVHYSRYFGDLGSSPGDLVRTAITDPGKVLAVLVSFRTLGYFLVLTAPLGLITWRRPIYLLAGVPTFLMLSLIQLGNDAGPNVAADANVEASAARAADASTTTVSQLPPVPYHHFHAPLLPVIFWAAAAGLRVAIPLASPQQPTHGPMQTLFAQLFRGSDHIVLSVSSSRARFAFFCALGTAMTGSMMPMGASFWSHESPFGYRRLYVPGPRAAEFAEVLPLLPQSSRVASTDYVHTRLTHFERSYDYSGYLRAVNNYQPGVPADTDFIVIDTSHPYSAVRTLDQVRELQTEPEQWELLPDTTNGLFIVLKRRVERLRDKDPGPH